MRAERALRKVSRDERNWSRAFSREIGEMDRRSGLAAAWADGKAEGRAEAKLEFAQKMKAMGLSIEQIAQGTGLSREDIERL